MIVPGGLPATNTILRGEPGWMKLFSPSLLDVMHMPYSAGLPESRQQREPLRSQPTLRDSLLIDGNEAIRRDRRKGQILQENGDFKKK